MTEFKARAALYEGVREELAERIRRGVYPPGSPLPSVASLTAEFGVSTITVKRAIRDLQMEGLIGSVPGIATIVRQKQRFIRDLDMAFGSPEDAKRLGQKASIKLLSVKQDKITDAVLQTFDPPSGYLLNVQRVIYADEVAIVHDSAFLTCPFDEAIVEELSNKFIYEMLKDRGVPVQKTRLLIDAAPASPEVLEAFSLPTGFPTLRRLYHHITANPAIAVYGLSVSPFDRLMCTIELRPPHSKPSKVT